MAMGKILVILCCIIYLVWHIQSEDFQWKLVHDVLLKIPYAYWVALPLISLASWLVESKKWQILVRDLRLIRFRESVIHNLAAQAASFVTPLRAGEFAVKGMYFPKNERKRALKAVFVGNMSQMFVTIVAGICGLLFLFHYPLVALLALTISGLLLYLLTDKINRWTSQTSLSIIKITGYSAGRYIIFSSCWWILLALVSDVSVWQIISAVAGMYLASSMIPTLQLFDVLIKWTIGSFFTSYLGLSLETITALIALLWLNNQVLPVVMGCILWSTHRTTNTAFV